MKFSIAIPVCGQANFLSSALNSIRAQSAEFQLAIMDATPDLSVQNVVSQFADLVFYHRRGPDDGQTSAIQEGWDATSGEIVAWLCADDYYFPDALSFVENMFKWHPEIDVIYGDSVFVDEMGRFQGYFSEINSDVSVITFTNCISQPSCFIRRKAFEAAGRLNTELHYIMDWDLWTRLFLSGARFMYVEKPLSVVRMHGNTKTASRSGKRYSELARHLLKHTSILKGLRSMLGFYYQDLSVSDLKGPEALLFSVLTDLRQVKQKMNAESQRGRGHLYGLEPRSNKVIETAQIQLPWYEFQRPTKVNISCNLQVAPAVFLNNEELELNEQGQYMYLIPASEQLSNILKFNLVSEVSGWHLGFLEVH